MDAIIVGAGLMGRWHADAARRNGVAVVAVVDRDAAAASRLASRFRGARPFATLTAALEGGRGHVVHVCTPMQTHGELARTAIGGGRHLLVEKPLVETLEETHELLALAASQRVLVCPVHQFLFERGLLRAKKSLPALGTLRHIDFATCSAGADRHPNGEDRIAIDILPHPFALVQRLAPDMFRQMSWHVARSGPGELRVLGETATLTASILISMNGRPPVNGIRLIGDRGTIHVDLFHGFATREYPGASGVRKLARPFVTSIGQAVAASFNLGVRAARLEPAYPGLRELVRRFYLAVEQRSPAPIDAGETLGVAAARQQVLDALTSQEVSLLSAS